MTQSRDKNNSGVPRRGFLKAGLAGAAGTAIAVKIPGLLDLIGKAEASEGRNPGGKWWGFLVDLTKCMGCGACVRACEVENEVPEGYFRTWVERYTFTRDGKIKVDSPDGAKNGFKADPEGVKPEEVTKSFFVPKLCNHCEDSPCVQVCPVGASYDSPDGVVLVDTKHCIGCGYCIQACPYGCRFLNPKGYADKCTLCYHRIHKGEKTACVQACPVGARLFGDLNDAESDIRKVIDKSRTGVLKPELGTHPKCFYLGLDQEVY